VGVIECKTAGGDDTMDMRVNIELLTPGSKISLRRIEWLRIWGFNSIAEAS